MKKIVFVGLIALLLGGCKQANTSLPKTDISKFKVSENQFKFPKGSSTIDLYNCLSEWGKSSEITGNTFFILNEKNTAVSLKKVEILTNRQDVLYSYIVKFSFNPVTVNGKKFSEKSFLFRYQYTVENVWDNDVLSSEMFLTKP